jgi:hypothetical protein
MRGSALIAALALAAAGCIQADEAPSSLASQASPITHGERDDSHPSVVGIGLLDPCLTDPPTVVCTGTVVAPRVVVTAAHCLDFPHELGRVFFGEDLEQSGDGALFAGASAHMQFDAVTFLDDIGVVFLREDAPVPPTALREAPLGPGDIGAQVQIVGYGLTETAGERPGLRRRGTSVITAVEATRIRTAPDPSMSCQLDSGGPVLMTVEGKDVLIGVTSSGDPFCKEYGLNTRVDAYFQSFLAPALASGGPPAPAPIVCPEVLDCTINGCPPGQTCDMLAGACLSSVRSELVAEPAGGCSLGSATGADDHGGVASVALLLALSGAWSRGRRGGHAGRSSRYSRVNARIAAHQR